MKYVIGIDLGTQSLKGLLVNEEGKIVAEASRAHDPSYPQPGWAEQKDVNDWEESMIYVVRKLLEDSHIDPSLVGTIGFDSQVDGAVAIDKDGHALLPAIIWLDRRAEAQCSQIGKIVPEEKIFERTGLNLDSSHVAPKLLWIKEKHPKVFEQCKNILLPGSWVVHYLTGESVVDYSNASSSMLYNVTEKAWDYELGKAIGINPDIMGRIGAAHEIAGNLTKKAADALGLTTKTKVIIGSGDEHAACVGSGLVKPGLVCDIVGTAEPVAAVAERPVFDYKHLVETHAHADSRWWLVENPGFVSGGGIRWFADNIAHTDFDTMNKMAAGIPVGSEGVTFLPCLSGAMTPRWNGNARGLFNGLSMSHTIDHMTRAVFEGCAFGFKDNIDRFEEIGLGCEEVRVVGGGTKSEIWCQMKADCTGKVLRCTRNPEGAAIGAAMLAGVAEGFFRDLDEAAGVMVELDKTFEPNPALKDQYEEAYQKYRAAYDAMEPVFDNYYRGV